MQTAIVGNGILALSTAFRLAKRSTPDDKIFVIGNFARPGSASLAAAAMLNSFAEIDAGSLDSEMDLYRFELSHLATRMWPKFILEIIRSAGYRLPAGCRNCEGMCGGCAELGTYIINNAAADDLEDENYEAILQALKDFDEPYQEISPRDIPNYMPEQRHRATRALYIPNEGWMNPRLTIDALDAALASFPQVEYIDCEVDRFLGKTGKVDAVVLDDGRVVEADQFVLATGATATDILQKSDLDLNVQRVFYSVGTSVEIKSPEYPHTKCIRTPNRGLACGLYTAPYFQGPGMPNDHILVGASNFISAKPYHHARLVNAESLMRGAMEQINVNFYRADLVRVNVGWRPVSQDTYPLLGRTSLDNLIIISGTKRDGFHLCPVISENIVSILFNEPVDERFSWFAPERELIKKESRQAAIDKAIRHKINALYQHDFTPAKGRMKDQLIQSYRDDLERLHDQVGAVDWGIPLDMLDMYRYGHAKY